MNIKRLLSWLMVLCLLLGLCGCQFSSRDEKEEESSITPLLYKVTDDEGNVLWLFGSIHVGYDYFYPLPDYVLDAYDSADAIAFELDMKAFEKDLSAQMEALTILVYQDGTTIRDHIDPELYEAAVAILEEEGYYNQALDVYMPILWSSFIDNCFTEKMDLDPDLGIDSQLLDMAYDDDKEILEVESAAFQYQMMASFSPELQAALLEGSVASFEDFQASKKDMQKLVDLWAGGDEEAFAAYLAEEDGFETEEDAKLSSEYNKVMITDRNIGMADFAEDALRSGDEVFICVGAAHIVGEGAMAQLLAQRGYTVELVGAA